MSYASRLIADSITPARPRIAAAPVVPLDVEVFVEAPRPEAIPRPVAHAVAPSSFPPRAVDAPDEADHRRRREPVDPASLNDAQPPPGRSNPDDAARGLVALRAESAARDVRLSSVADVTRPARIEQTTAIAGTDAGSIMVDAPAVEHVEHTDRRPPAAMEPPVDDGIAWRRLSGTDRISDAARPVVVVPAALAPDPAAQSLDVAIARIREPESRDVRPDLAAPDLDVQSVLLSIGSIEVVVDGPTRDPAPAPVATPMAPPVNGPRQDRVLGLRRQYVTWPDGG